MFTAQSKSTPRPGVTIRVCEYPWSFGALKAMTKQLVEWRPGAVVIQYAPNLVSPEWNGVHLSFAAWVAQLKSRLNATVAITAHELNYPVMLSLSGIALGIPQFAQIRAAIAVADHAFFTYDAALEKCAFALPWKKASFSQLPVGSNIPLLKGAFAKGLELVADKRVLLHFGGSHPTNLFRQMFEALEHALKAYGDSSVVLALAGINESRAQALLAESGFEHLHKRVFALGYVAADAASAWLKRANLVLAPFLDGVSTRRGSVMAALSHGSPVLTNLGWASSGRVPWSEICALSPGEAYGRSAVELLNNPESCRALGQRGLEFYEKHFSWQTIAERMMRELQ